MSNEVNHEVHSIYLIYFLIFFEKRPWSTNWDENEKAVFLESIKTKIKILENKKKLTVLDKNNAWDQVKEKMKVEGLVSYSNIHYLICLE